jgi:hypothetical protein
MLPLSTQSGDTRLRGIRGSPPRLIVNDIAELFLQSTTALKKGLNKITDCERP